MIKRVFANLCICIWFMLASLPARAEDVELTGVWQVSGFTKAFGNLDFLVQIAPYGPNRWQARKLSGSRNVPVGRVHFRGQVRDAGLEASVQVAFPGFGDPEWENHSFDLKTDETGKVTSIVLNSGETHHLDDTGDNSFTDKWTYTPWPENRYLLSAPRVTRNGYGAEKSFARNDHRRAQDDVSRWEASRVEAQARLTAAQATEFAMRGKVDGLEIAYEASWRAVLEAKSTDVAPPPDRSALPSRLRVLYRSQDEAKADVTRFENIILEDVNGTTPQSRDTIAQMFKNIDHSKAYIERMERTIVRVREELGIEPDADPNEGRAERIAAAEAAYETAGDALFAARGALSRSKTETGVSIGQVDLSNREIAKGQELATQANARLKFLNASGSLTKIEGYALGGAEPRLIFEAIPSGLDVELKKLQKVIDEVADLLKQSHETAEAMKTAFEAAFDRGTVQRDRMASLIMENAVEMAVLQGGAKLGEIALAFGTGGPIGLAVEIVTTPMFQFALYEDGVVFENYDESAMARQYRSALANATQVDPDPQAACDGLSFQINEAITGLVASETSALVQSYLKEVRNSGNRSVNADLENALKLGNPSQRLNPNLLNYTAIGVSGVVNEGVNSLGDRVIMSTLAQAASAFEARVGQRAGQALLNEIASLDTRLVNPALTSAARASAMESRAAVLRRFALQNPDMATAVTRNIDEVAKQMDQLEKIIRLATNNPSAAEGQNAARIAARRFEQIGQGQNALRRALGASIPEINVEQSLAAHRTLWAKLGQDLQKLDGMKSAFTKAGLRGTLKGAGANIALSLVFAVGLEANVQRLQQQELELWQEIFGAEMEQSMMYRAWQRARCIEWALLDQRDFLRRNYAKLFAAYDPEAELQIMRSEPILIHEAVRIRLFFEPTSNVRMATKIAGVACPRSTESSCQTQPGELGGAQGPYLPVSTDLSPP